MKHLFIILLILFTCSYVSAQLTFPSTQNSSATDIVKDNIVVNFTDGALNNSLGENIFVTQSENNFVNVLFAQKQKAQVMLLNAIGQLYFETIKFSNRDKVSINTNGFAPGIYFLQITQGRKKYAQKIIVNQKG